MTYYYSEFIYKYITLFTGKIYYKFLHFFSIDTYANEECVTFP